MKIGEAKQKLNECLANIDRLKFKQLCNRYGNNSFRFIRRRKEVNEREGNKDKGLARKICHDEFYYSLI